MKIYCSGIGGIGLSSYASLQNAAGHTVLGSDTFHTTLLDDVRSQGIQVFLEQDGTHIPQDVDLFVYSEAIPKNSPEREKASVLGIPQQSYFEALGELSRDSYVIAVCGTHGKSSTVAMAARVLLFAGIDATIQCGTKLRELNGRNWKKGSSTIFLLEACEYRCSFHSLSPDMILLTNVDGDHFDAFTDIDAYQEAYRLFLEKLPQDGFVLTHLSDGDCQNVVSGIGRRVIDVDAYPLPELSTPGKHMQQNAQLVLAMAEKLGIDRTSTAEILKGYEGCWRRLEHKGTLGKDILVIDDYGHHPVEIRATLSALKEAYPARKLFCVFQPHTHDRTLKLYKEFTESFASADEVILTDVYEARKEIEREEIDIHLFAKDIASESTTSCSFGGSFEEIEGKLRGGAVQEGELLLCLGAGTITRLAEHLVSDQDTV